jgi:hypothetical protein
MTGTAATLLAGGSPTRRAATRTTAAVTPKECVQRRRATSAVRPAAVALALARHRQGLVAQPLAHAPCATQATWPMKPASATILVAVASINDCLAWSALRLAGGFHQARGGVTRIAGQRDMLRLTNGNLNHHRLGEWFLGLGTVRTKSQTQAGRQHRVHVLHAAHPSRSDESGDGARFFLEAKRRLLVVLIGI